MEYNLDVTLEHPYSADFAHSFNDLVREDGGSGIFPYETVAISLDEVEKSFRKAHHAKTMDAALGVIKRGTVENPRNKRMLLCELRFNYKNPANISKGDIDGKVNYSKNLLTSFDMIGVEPKCYFLFNCQVVEQAKSFFSRIYVTRTQTRIVCTEEEFKNLLHL